MSAIFSTHFKKKTQEGTPTKMPVFHVFFPTKGPTNTNQQRTLSTTPGPFQRSLRWRVIWSIAPNFWGRTGRPEPWKILDVGDKSRWWFQIFFIFIPIWGRFPFWLIFFKGVETMLKPPTRKFWCWWHIFWWVDGTKCRFVAFFSDGWVASCYSSCQKSFCCVKWVPSPLFWAIFHFHELWEKGCCDFVSVNPSMHQTMSQ